jgi:hypothetical protein
MEQEPLVPDCWDFRRQHTDVTKLRRNRGIASKAIVKICPVINFDHKKADREYFCKMISESAAVPVGFEMSDQRAVTGTRFGEGADATQVRAESAEAPRLWCRVEINLAALELGSLTHRQALRPAIPFSAVPVE